MGSSVIGQENSENTSKGQRRVRDCENKLLRQSSENFYFCFQ